MTVPIKQALTWLCATLPAVGFAACGAATVSTSSFKGEANAIAQTISNLQADVTAGDEQKICKNDLSSSLVTRLGATGSSSAEKGCEQAIKSQLTEVDNPALTLTSVQVKGTTASARVKSIYLGKTQFSTMTLVKEDGKWRVSGLG
jgi:hypothetical protein